MPVCKLDFHNHDLEAKLDIVAPPESAKMGAFDPKWCPE